MSFAARLVMFAYAFAWTICPTPAEAHRGDTGCLTKYECLKLHAGHCHYWVIHNTRCWHTPRMRYAKARHTRTDESDDTVVKPIPEINPNPNPYDDPSWKDPQVRIRIDETFNDISVVEDDRPLVMWHVLGNDYVGNCHVNPFAPTKKVKRK
jgi:hypothetical protein